MSSRICTKYLDIVAENLAKVRISGEPLTQCCKIAILLDKLLKQRERTIANLTRAAESLNKHLRKSAIAKTVGASVSAGEKAVTATGAGAMVVTAGTGFIAAAGLTVVGVVAFALGSIVTVGTYAVEQWLCSDVVTEANRAIKEDQSIADKLKKAWETVTSMLEPFHEKFQHIMSITMIINAVWKVFKQIKDFVSEENFDWKSVVSKATNGSMKEKDQKSKAIEKLKSIIVNAFKSGIDMVMDGISKQAALVAAILGVGAILVGFDGAVLVANVATLATDKEHPAAVEIKSKVEMLKDERNQLQSFHSSLEKNLPNNQ